MATLMEELRVDPVVQEVIFFLPPKVRRSKHRFFFLLEENVDVQPSLCFFLFFIVVWKVLPLEGI